ncbi:Enterobactin synthetase component F, serine activating enzyme [Cronobacter dublinensis 582]|nr:Enterobactin synthetase component F, serine activating enzyme [Cronobacter dublinensis 582]
MEVTDAQADFFALGGHSLLAMRLAALLTRELARPVTVGQVMIAPTVEKLAAQVNAGGSEAEAGFEAVLPLRDGTALRPDAVLLPPGVGLRLAVQRVAALAVAALGDYGHSVAAPGRPDAAVRVG